MIEVPFDPIRTAIPLFVALVLLEIAAGRFWKARVAYEGRDAWTSLLMGFGNTVQTFIMLGLISAVMLWVYEYRVFDIPIDAWWAWVAVFFLDDLIFYWTHRISHERRIWWASHVNHHSSQHFNLSTALRQPWTGLIVGTWTPWLLLIWLGFPPAMIVVQNGVSLVYQFWIHTEAIGKTPRWFEAVFNTPSHHRVHHARNPRYLDANYAGILIVWDRLFGTFIEERADEPCKYGIVKNLGGFNILRVAFHEWMAIFQDIGRSPRHAMGYLFGPPGWSPDGSRETSATIKAKWRARMDSAAEEAKAA
ncbi:MAG TPA: sterol desaturase family protein [Caulobacteraceae bacterium]|nr:sterol desaturase family protein [Caulobacteraceae bacterium]